MYPTINLVKTGAKIKYYMQLNHLTPKDIQEYLCLTCVQTVYHWLSGDSVPNIDNLYALSILFHVGLDDLVVGNYSQSHVIKENNIFYSLCH